MPSRAFLLTLGLLLAAALAYLLGNGAASLFDRDEPRYALTSRNMLTSGDFVVPRQFENKVRTAKPPLIYWLQAGSMKLFGQTSAFAARLPSSLAMLAVVALLLLFLRSETDQTTALLSAAVFSTSALVLFLAKTAITDATLLVFTALSLHCLYNFWRGDRSWPTVLLYAVATGLSFLTKGPVTLGVQLTTAAALWALTHLDRKYPPLASWRTFPSPFDATPTPALKTLGPKALVAAAIILAIALPWFILVELRAGGFLSKIISNDLVKRTTQGVDGQARPPGFYLVTLFGTFFPYSLFLPASLVVAWKNRHRPLTRFCLAACVGPWLMFEASTSKMVHWFLPVFLPLSILTGDAVARCWRTNYPYLSDRPFRYFALAWGTFVGLLGLTSWFLAARLSAPWCTAALLSVWSIAFGATAAWHLFRVKLPQAVATMAAAMAVLFPILFSLVFPHWPYLNLSRNVGQDLASRRADSVLMTTFREPAAAFYQNHPIREAELSALTTPPFPDLLTITADDFNALPEPVRNRWQILATHRGIAYAKKASAVIDVHIVAPKR